MHRVLLIHPNEKLLDLYNRPLRKHFDLHTAQNGLMGLRKIKQLAPHIIYSSYHLPLLSGVALIKFTRAYSKTAATPFIFLSDSGSVEQGLNLGADGWIDLTVSSPDFIIGYTFDRLKNIVKII